MSHADDSQHEQFEGFRGEDELDGGVPGGLSGLSRECFQDRMNSLLEWLADRDPARAARLIGDFLDDLADELGPAASQAT